MGNDEKQGLRVLRKEKTKRCANILDKVIAHRLRVARHETGLSLDELSQKVGVSHQQLQKYETSKNRIPSGRLLILASILGVSLDHIVGQIENFNKSASK